MDVSDSYCQAAKIVGAPRGYLYDGPTISAIDDADDCPCEPRDTYCRCPDAAALKGKDESRKERDWKEIAAVVAMVALMLLPFFRSRKKGPPDGPDGSGGAGGKDKPLPNGGNMPPSEPAIPDVFSSMETEPAPLYGLISGGVGLLHADSTYGGSSDDGVWKWVALGVLVAANVASFIYFRRKKQATAQPQETPPPQPVVEANKGVADKRGTTDNDDPPPTVTVGGLLPSGEGNARPTGASRTFLRHPLRAMVLGSRTALGLPLPPRVSSFSTAAMPFLTLRFR